MKPRQQDRNCNKSITVPIPTADAVKMRRAELFRGLVSLSPELLFFKIKVKIEAKFIHFKLSEGANL